MMTESFDDYARFHAIHGMQNAICQMSGMLKTLACMLQKVINADILRLP